MITEVKKYLIFGVKKDLDVLYQRAQEAGFLEFIREGKKLAPIPDEMRPLVTAIKFLRSIDGVLHEKSSLGLSLALKEAERVLHLREELVRAEEERKVTLAEQARIAPFGDFSLEDLDYLESQGKRSIQFFCAKAGKAGELCEKEEGLILIDTVHGMDYFVSVQEKPKTYAALVEMQIESSMQELKNRYAFLGESIRQMEEELKGYAKKLKGFQGALAEGLNEYYLASAKELAARPLADSSFFSVEVFVPVSKVSKLPSLLDGLFVDYEEVQIEEGDKVPTAMENEGVNKIGEDLVKIYDVPATTDKDPSGWVFWCFSVFFAMIVADAGYGTLYLAFAAYLKWKFKTFKGMMKRMYRLILVLASFVVIWGVLTLSFFGLDIAQDNPLRKVSPLQKIVEAKADYHIARKDGVYREWVGKFPEVSSAKSGADLIEITTAKPPKAALSPVVAEFSNNILLELSLVVGILHIALSLLRYLRRGFAAIGWVIFLIGGYLFFPSMLRASSMVHYLGIMSPETATVLGKNLVYGGIGTALLLSILQNGLSGIKELMRLMEVFGDVLSYVRLYALSLAGAIMASTFNEIGMSIGGSGIGMVAGFFVILAGHLTNMALGLMSGVIHGLRLNFIEWYHYSFDGEGRAFNPLKLLKTKED